MAALAGYFAVHSRGLHHASRAVALGRGLQGKRPDLDILFLAGVPALDFVVANGFDAMPMPPAPDASLGVGSLRRSWDRARHARIARRFLRREADWAHRRFLISDGDIVSVEEAMRNDIPSAVILPEARDGLSAGRLDRLLRGARLVLASDTNGLPPAVRRIGPVVRPFHASREALREDLVFRKKTILVTAGGTARGDFLLREVIASFRRLHLDDAALVVVTGPMLKAEPSPGVYVYGFVPNLHDFVLAADLVITTAGEGTVSEALVAGTPLIAIPPAGLPDAEKRAAALGFTHEDLRRLDDLIPEKLAAGRRPGQDTDAPRVVSLFETFLAEVGA